MASLRYEGPLENVEVVNFGHFKQGEEKRVDALTAAAFKCKSCYDEGWRVLDDNKNLYDPELELLAIKDEDTLDPRVELPFSDGQSNSNRLER